MKNLFRFVQFPFFFCCFLFFEHETATAQKSSAAKTFLGAAGSLHWSSTGVSAGLMAERILHSKRNLELSIQGTHTFRHTYGNLILFSAPSYDFSSSETGLGVTGYLFTNRHKINTGFYIAGFAGAQLMNEFSKSDNSSYHFVLPAAELSFGCKFRMSRNTSARLNCGARFIGGFTSTATFALGF